jgi:MFS family permease
MIAILTAAFLFNIGQGVLRPSMPLYLRDTFAAHYRMVTLIPVVFGAGKWFASAPTGVLQDRLGRRRVMVAGLLVIAATDIASALVQGYLVFLGLRGLSGVGWAMFGTVATTAMVDTRTSARRGRAVSLLLVSETVGLLIGTAGGGWLYQGVGAASPFFLEAAVVAAGAVVVGWSAIPVAAPATPGSTSMSLRTVLRIPGVLRMGVASAALIAVQTGVMVFLFPLYLASRASLAPGAVGVLVSFGVVGRLLALWLGGAVATPVGRARLLVAGLTSYGVVLGGLVMLDDPVMLGFVSLAAGAAAGLVAPLPAALVGDLVPAARRGAAIGCLRWMTDTGQIVGPLTLGALADATDLVVAFLAAAVLLAGAASFCRWGWAMPNRTCE